MASMHSESHGFGKPQIVLPRSGQGSFRILVTEAYERRCALTGERALPVLDAAHIKPYAVLQRHEVCNGILMRSDLHRLFDEGYITIDPLDRKITVSNRIREEFENGKEYYRLHDGLCGSPPLRPTVHSGITSNITPTIRFSEHHLKSDIRIMKYSGILTWSDSPNFLMRQKAKFGGSGGTLSLIRDDSLVTEVEFI